MSVALESSVKKLKLVVGVVDSITEGGKWEGDMNGKDAWELELLPQESLTLIPLSSDISVLRKNAFEQIRADFLGKYVLCKEIWGVVGVYRRLVYQVIAAADTREELNTKMDMLPPEQLLGAVARYVS